MTEMVASKVFERDAEEAVIAVYKSKLYIHSRWKLFFVFQFFLGHVLRGTAGTYLPAMDMGKFLSIPTVYSILLRTILYSIYSILFQSINCK